MSTRYQHFDPFLSPKDAQAMLRIAESYGSFGTYADEATSEGLGEQLPQRFDAALNYVSGGIDGSGNADDADTAGHRTNYFRETYAYGADVRAEGIEPFLENAALLECARTISGSSVIIPAIVYANLLVPGQELAIHTDVPEFRGANRKLVPQWLLVCMLHSGLFDAWRIPILTCVSWFGNADGGAFTFYPEGAGGRRESIAADHNSAILIDTDKVFHGVERVRPAEVCPAEVRQGRADIPPIGKHTRLHFCGDDAWELREGDTVLSRHSWTEVRYSISWKAYCFRDEAEAERWRAGSDNLGLDDILNRFEDELGRRGLIPDGRPDPTEFALMMVREFVRFPGQAAA
jgi:hypothetical protein